MANAYFLLLGLLELIKPISDSGGVPVLLMPLTFVIVVSMIKDAFEDSKRHKQDDLENNRSAFLANADTNEFKEVKWRDLTVGSIVKIY